MTCTEPLRRRHASLLLVTLFVTTAAAQRSGSTIDTAKIFEALGIREALTACEIGAGDGELTLAAARLVGPQGRIYTSELGDERVKTLEGKVAGSGFAHITVVEGDPARTNFPDGACDAVFMRNVYHHFADPAAMNLSIAAALKPGGRLAIVDFSPPGAEAEQAEDRDRDGRHGVSAGSVSRELKDAGFEPVLTQSGSQRWFMTVLAKPPR